MGRYAQRRLAGGGVAALVTMTSAEENAPDELIVRYSTNIDASQFDGSFFTTSPAGEAGVVVLQAGPNGLLVTFSGAISTETTLTYTGNVPSVQNPQTINITH